MLFLAAACVALVAAGCNPAQQRQADRTGTTIQEKGREVFNKAATATENAALATKVKQALNLRQGLSTKRIEVNADAKTGAITLEGSVPNMQQRKVAEDVARNTDGVHSVVNQLAVPPTTSAQR
jgi:osmotically-inducible protein OsmY